jgi:hypothetical protein
MNYTAPNDDFGFDIVKTRRFNMIRKHEVEPISLWYYHADWFVGITCFSKTCQGIWNRWEGSSGVREEECTRSVQLRVKCFKTNGPEIMGV